MSSPLPERIGHYDVLGELGRGGMGVVYKVREPASGQLAALKIVDPERLGRRETALRFKREFRAMQRVKHPNVIRVFEAGTHEGCPFFTMELVEGHDIGRWLDGPKAIVASRNDPLPEGPLAASERELLNDPKRVRRLGEAILQAALALTAIHHHRIVHRDLKPDNIHVSKAGVLKLMDFGIAKQMVSTEHSSGNVVVGTFKYLSPEQALGHAIDGRADLYCLGIIFYELLAGRHPFYAESSVGYAFHHARTPLPPLQQLNPEVHPGLRDICHRLLEKDPSDRFPTADDLVHALRAALAPPARAVGGDIHEAPTAPPQAVRQTLFAPKLVGREGALRKLDHFCEQTRDGLGGVAWVSGGGGLGKSRLLREATGHARAQSVRVLSARAHPDDRAYRPWLDVLDQLLSEELPLPGSLPSWVGAEAGVLARYLPEHPAFAGQHPVAPLDPTGERARFFAAYATVLERAAMAHPRWVVLDDLHCADEMTIELTLHLAHAIADIGQVSESVAYRLRPLSLVVALDPRGALPSSLQTFLPELRRSDAVLDLELLPLVPEQVGRMLETMVGGDTVADALGRALHAETGGVPGQVEARVRAWVETGALRKEAGRWVLVRRSDPGSTVAATSADGVVQLACATPGDLPGILPREATSRVHGLSAIALDVGQRAAAAGERIELSLLSRIALRSEDELLDAVDELVRAEFLSEEAADGGYRFLSSGRRGALLKDLDEPRRRALHLLVANAREADARQRRVTPDPEQLYRHYASAGATVLALEQLLRAAWAALQADALQTVDEHIERAEELRAEAAVMHPFSAALGRWEVQILRLRLEVHAARGQHRACVERATAWLPKRHGVDLVQVGEVLLRLAASERMLGHLDAALRHAGEALHATERGDAPALRCRVKNLCGRICEQRGMFEQSRRYLVEALELARRIGDRNEEENASAALAYRSLDCGDLAAAELTFRRLYDAARGRGERLRTGRYLHALGRIAHTRARFEEAESHYRRALQLLKAAGHPRSVAVGISHLATLRRDESRTEEAARYCAKALQLFRKLGDQTSEARMWTLEAQILLGAGDASAARARADAAARALADSGTAAHMLDAEMTLALATAEVGEHAAGRQQLERGEAAARALDLGALRLWAHYALARVEQLAHQEVAAARWLTAGIALARRYGDRRYELRLASLRDPHDGS